MSSPSLHPPALQAGASLIEAVIAMVVLGILVAMGVPAFTEWLNNAQIRTAAESMLSGLQTARNEAVRRNANVQFTLTNPTVIGGTGWMVSIVGSGQQVQAAAAGEGSRTAIVTPTPSDAYAVTFTGYGRTPEPPANLNADGSSLLTQIDFDSSVLSAAASRELRIVITAGGQIRMCDPNIGDTTNPRAC